MNKLLNVYLNALYLMSMFCADYEGAGINGAGINGAGQLSPVLAVMSGLGGGLIRDVTILHVHPYLFTADGLRDVCLILGGFTFAPFLKKDKHWRKTFDALSRIIDLLAFPVYLAMGYSKAISLGFPFPIAVASGVVTATGGGTLVFAILHHGKNLEERIPVTGKALVVSLAFSHYTKSFPENAVQVGLGVLFLLFNAITTMEMPRLSLEYSLAGAKLGGYLVEAPRETSLKHTFLDREKNLERLVKLLLKQCASTFAQNERKGINIV